MAAIDRASPSTSSRSPSPLPSVGEGAVAENTLFVAVNREFKESESVLLWALQNRGASQITLLHVHIPDQEIAVGFGSFSKIQVRELPKPQVDAHRVRERERLATKMDKYLQLCHQKGVNAGKIHVELDSIKNGIVKLITENKIEKLVMGAASDSKYSKDMTEILSEKAKYVKQHAPAYCHIWFVCKKFLIHTREATERPGLYPVIYTGDECNEGLRPLPSAPVVTFNEQMATPNDSSPSGSMSPFISPPRRSIEESIYIVQYLERRLESAAEMVEKYKKERDEMQMERDNAIKQVDEVKEQLNQGVSRAIIPNRIAEVNSQDIEKTTNRFDQSLKFGEDYYGITYKGFFNIQVAVKIAHPNSPSAPQEFQEEVEILSKLRHPNIVNLIGICSESKALIYEYCANGNLEDQISYKTEGSPLLWKTRIKIAMELCSVLMFLHSHRPQAIIHGDVRAVNIHLDSDFSCKLNNFITSISISNGTYSLENAARFYKSDSIAASYASTDPEYLSTEEFTTRSDVYSFGIILLRLLTGKPAIKLVRLVQSAVENTDELRNLLDPTAEWPIQQAKLLADLGLRCCQMTRDRRPDLDPDVWNALESINGLRD